MFNFSIVIVFLAPLIYTARWLITAVKLPPGNQLKSNYCIQKKKKMIKVQKNKRKLFNILKKLASYNMMFYLGEVRRKTERSTGNYDP